MVFFIMGDASTGGYDLYAFRFECAGMLFFVRVDVCNFALNDESNNFNIFVLM